MITAMIGKRFPRQPMRFEDGEVLRVLLPDGRGVKKAASDLSEDDVLLGLGVVRSIERR